MLHHPFSYIQRRRSRRRRVTDSVLAGIRRHYAKVVDILSYVGLGLVLYAGPCPTTLQWIELTCTPVDRPKDKSRTQTGAFVCQPRRFPGLASVTREDDHAQTTGRIGPAMPRCLPKHAAGGCP